MPSYGWGYGPDRSKELAEARKRRAARKQAKWEMMKRQFAEKRHAEASAG